MSNNQFHSKVKQNSIQIPNFKGEVYTGEVMRTLYATDASVYRELPQAVVLPYDADDVGAIVAWAYQNRVPLIPRAGGTSLAGQVVGSGVVVDVSKHLNRIIEVDAPNRRVRVEPGVVRNQLNAFIKPHGLFFAPITSTATRANIGGMIGNNSCGSNSIIYGSVREHLVSVSGYLSDGSKVTFKEIHADEFKSRQQDYEKGNDRSLENEIYIKLHNLLSDTSNQKNLRTNYPPPEVTRRNTGYALDSLLRTNLFDITATQNFNLSLLIAGSEGTLMMITEATLNLVPLPPKYQAVVCIHCHSINQALLVNVEALKHSPSASELVDDFILQCTKNNITQQKNRSFVEGDPNALLAVEFHALTQNELEEKISTFKNDLIQKGYRLSAPVLYGEEVHKVWDLRAAGLGLLSTQPGDAKPYAVVEDAAVNPIDLPNFITEFDREMETLGLKSIYYAHAGSGELHLRPIFNLKTAEGKHLFRKAAEAMVMLVKKYRGSLSGEHGDGRLRGEFISQVLGTEIYNLLKEVKNIFDSQKIFNSGKIIDSPPMDEKHRYEIDHPIREVETIFDFSHEQGILRAAEMCNGSADCRKGVESGGTMCPSYMALKSEKETTRARANILREMLTRIPQKYRHKKTVSDYEYFDSEEILEVMKFCLSCKGCKAECPSNVDIAKMKAEFLQQYYFSHRIPLSLRMITGLPQMLDWISKLPAGRKMYNMMVNFPPSYRLLTKVLNFSNQRPLPQLSSTTLKSWFKHWSPQPSLNPKFSSSSKTVYFFADEFTNHQRIEVGQSAIKLLQKLGYRVVIPHHGESGRTAISKGLLIKAREAIRTNLKELSPLINQETPLIGVEPSCILTFRDEAISLLRGEEQKQMRTLSGNVFLLEEFLSQEIDKGVIDSSRFTKEERKVVCHIHCHQKALSDSLVMKKVLSLPQNYQVEIIPSGCCGMAGSFGYEKNNYEVSLKIGELVLFPHLRQCNKEVLIAASGISCREQIHHGVEKTAYHPAQILEKALQ